MNWLAHRATCWLVLVLFGGMSAVGPYWHRHSDCEGSCHVHGESSLASSCNNAIRHSHSHFDGHSHSSALVDTQCKTPRCKTYCETDHAVAVSDLASRGERSSRSLRLTQSFNHNPVDDCCSICQFYSASASTTAWFELALIWQANPLAEMLSAQHFCRMVLNPVIRGPPR